jgi:hypothetical protein
MPGDWERGISGRQIEHRQLAGFDQISQPSFAHMLGSAIRALDLTEHVRMSGWTVALDFNPD